MLRKFLYIVGGLVFSVVLVTAVGLGVWANNLNTRLTQAQAENQALQSDYDELSAEYSKAQDDFEAESVKVDAKLNDAQAQIQTLEGDLKKARDDSAKLKTKLAEIQRKVAMLNAFWFMSDSAFQGRVNASDDEQLQGLYETLMNKADWNSYADLMSYMIQSIADVSDVSLQSYESANSAGIGSNG